MSVDYALIMFLLALVTGVIWALDAFWFAPQRRKAGIEREPVAVEYARSLFPVILIIFVLRSFLAEPFRIPSSSMEPTLEEGDFILVNKYTYGIRLPVLDRKVIEVGEPAHGDVVVFRFPADPRQDYIKRIVGLPGDEVSYYQKQLYINGEPVEEEQLGPVATETGLDAMAYRERIGDEWHAMLKMPERHDPREGSITVPEGYYFVMGDNRDNSNDSRSWGFVPEQNLVGRAFFIWMNWRIGDWPEWDRIGTIIE